MKPEELVGAEVVSVEGTKATGCFRCNTPRGRLKYHSIVFKLQSGVECELTVEGSCPPDMETSELEMEMVIDPPGVLEEWAKAKEEQAEAEIEARKPRIPTGGAADNPEWK